jgi:hypothetical protein
MTRCYIMTIATTNYSSFDTTAGNNGARTGK